MSWKYTLFEIYLAQLHVMGEIYRNMWCGHFLHFCPKSQQYVSNDNYEN